ncbi:MAG: long-chain fatty acid--CoA ligase [Rhizobium sp.]|nr:long-chain fatty acid--CoA ligase [Rhizobium sp.]
MPSGPAKSSARPSARASASRASMACSRLAIRARSASSGGSRRQPAAKANRTHKIAVKAARSPAWRALPDPEGYAPIERILQFAAPSRAARRGMQASGIEGKCMGFERPWLANYPKGIAPEVDLEKYPSIVSVLEETCREYRDNPAFANFGKKLSYAEIDRLSTQFANYLLHELKLKKGDRVALMMPNILQYPIAIFGVLRAGLTVVNTNPMYTARELRHQLTDSGASAIVVLENFAHVVADVVADTSIKQVIVTGVGDMLGFPKGPLINFVLRHVRKEVPDYDLPGYVRFNETLALGARHQLPAIDIRGSDIAFLQYTGGTTGVAKGAMLTHRNLVANMQQSSVWIGTNATMGKEVIITALPLYHIFALTANCLVFMKFGGLNYLITNPRDMKGFVAELRKIPFTAITGVNTLFNGLLNTPGFDQVDFSRLHLTLGGGMAVQRAVAERWKKVTGVTLVEAYGLTETSPAACINPMDLPEYNGAIGLPIPSTDACVKDDEGRMLPMGEVGELCIKGPQVMAGYWQRPEETAKVIDADGWLHTGDMAKMDPQGFFYIVDRKKDMILVSGFNVYPNEVEDVIALMPGVLEVAAVGVPDEKSGEAVKVVIVRKDPALTAEQVKDFCREQLTGYKHPRYVEFRTELPKSNVGKILRRELRDSAAKA